MEPVVIGIDVSKDSLDVATPEGVSQWDNLPHGHSALIEQLANWTIESIIIEATGGYERPLVAELLAAGLPVIVVNPTRAEHTTPESDHALSSLERQHIMKVIAQTGGNKARAARQLGLSRRALYRRLERHGLAEPSLRRES